QGGHEFADIVKANQFCQTSEIDEGIRCPSCRSEAVYRYGKTGAGKQRYYCLLCEMQFTGFTKRTFVRSRPLCPVSGNPMHLYMRSGEKYRFRCSKYPQCGAFMKMMVRRDDESARRIISCS
ncbi:MAG: transposase, partial [Dissulfurispiraceae bacterium]